MCVFYFKKYILNFFLILILLINNNFNFKIFFADIFFNNITFYMHQIKIQKKHMIMVVRKKESKKSLDTQISKGEEEPKKKE